MCPVWRMTHIVTTNTFCNDTCVLALLLLHWLEGNTEELIFLMTRHYFFSNICSNRKKDGQRKVSYGLKVRVITG